MDTYEEKVAALHARLAALPGVIVAFSGGVDSTMLLQAALEALGRERVVAVTADSPSFPRAEKEEALALARNLGVPHEILPTAELAVEGYRRNAPDRCYFCKAELFGQIARRIRARDLPDWPILHGATGDDRLDHRPGARAAREQGVLAPLAEAGLRKEEIRRYSRERGLPTADKPSFACLASRFPYEVMIAPVRHMPNFTDMRNEDLLGLAGLLKDILQRLKMALDDPPYNYFLSTAPNPAALEQEEWDAAHLKAAGHWHLEILPRQRPPAGFEWGSGFHINPGIPEDAARHLREIGTQRGE